MENIFIFLLYAVMIFVCFWPYAIIAERTGITRWFMVTQLIPIVNVIALWYLATAKWKVDADNKLIDFKDNVEK